MFDRSGPALAACLLGMLTFGVGLSARSRIKSSAISISFAAWRLRQGRLRTDPEKGYVERFGTAAHYSDLLKFVTRPQTERARLLRGFFEPTDAKLPQGNETADARPS